MQSGPSRLHVPGQPPGAAGPPMCSLVINGPDGKPISTPVVYVGVLDQTALEQIGQRVKGAIDDSIRDYVAAIAAMIAQAFSPPVKTSGNDPATPQPTEPTEPAAEATIPPEFFDPVAQAAKKLVESES